MFDLIIFTVAVILSGLCCSVISAFVITLTDGGNGKSDTTGDIADTPSEVEIETPEESEPTNGGTEGGE